MRGGIKNYCTTQLNSGMCNAQQALAGGKATKSRKHARSHKRHAKRGGYSKVSTSDLPDPVTSYTGKSGFEPVLGGKVHHAKKASRKVHHRRHRGGSQQTCGPVAPQAGAQCNSGSAQNYVGTMVGHADVQLMKAQQNLY